MRNSQHAPTIDLTPFGFTPTETLAYHALLGLGPSSGYAVARELGIARANAYQALSGLQAKGAGELASNEPRIYRAIRPDALFARLVEREAQKLDVLEAQVSGKLEGATQVVVPVASHRAFAELATRWVVRLTAPAACLAPGLMLSALIPAWRARAVDRRQTALWCVGDPPELPISLAGVVSPDRVNRWFGAAAALVIAGDAVLVARLDGTAVSGYWSSDRVITAAVGAAFAHLTLPEGGAP